MRRYLLHIFILLLCFVLIFNYSKTKHKHSTGGHDLKILSYNIDGISSVKRNERCLYFIELINEINPDVLLLQEVVFEHVKLFEKHLTEKYDIQYSVSESNRNGYFTAILSNKQTIKVLNTKIIPFDSEMERNLIKIKVKSLNLTNKPIIELFTSHFESLSSGKILRLEQLELTARYLTIFSDESVDYKIFAGDTNLREDEVKNARTSKIIEKNIVFDAFEEFGNPKDAKYTFDTTKNHNLGIRGITKQTRYDRLYFTKNPKTSSTFTVKDYKLIGTKNINSIQLHPSDHFGILVVFSA